MPQHDMFNNRESQSGATLFPARSRIDAIKSLDQAGQMMGGNAASIVP